MYIKNKPDFKTTIKPVIFVPEEEMRDALILMCKKNIGSIIVVNSEYNKTL